MQKGVSSFSVYSSNLFICTCPKSFLKSLGQDIGTTMWEVKDLGQFPIQSAQILTAFRLG